MTEDLDKDMQDMLGDLENAEEPAVDVSLEDTLEAGSEEGEGIQAEEGEGEGIELDEDLQSMLGEEQTGDEDALESEEASADAQPAVSDEPGMALTAEPDEETRALAEVGDSVNLDYLLDIKLNVTFEVGRAKMLVTDLLTLGQGSVIELHRLVGDELDLLINGRLVAKGEVVVVNEKFGCKVTTIIPPEERVKHLGGF